MAVHTSPGRPLWRRCSLHPGQPRITFSFPPRLEVVVEEQIPDGFPSHSGDQFPLHGFLYYQPHSPASAALRWVTTDHGDDALLLAIVQNLRRTRPLLFVERAFQAAFLVAMANL